MNLKSFGILIVIVLIVSMFGALFGIISINEPLNKIVAGSPDKSCNSDSDCAMKQIDCDTCSYGSKGDAINKKWQTYCPLKEGILLGCPSAIPKWKQQSAICESNMCRVVSR